MDMKTRKMDAEGSLLSRMGSAILHKRLNVRWLPEGSSDLGFTSGMEGKGGEVTVNVCWYNEQYMGELDEVHQAAFRMGVFAHELLHQVFTNFNYFMEIMNNLSRAQASVEMEFINTLEDPAIEYFAPQVFGGKLLSALKYVIGLIYSKSPGIESSKDAFTQLMNALIHFGDMGIIKGEFTFPEAYTYFIKIAPLYNEGITEPDSERRIDIARECAEIARPLWEEYVKDAEAFQRLMEALQKAMESAKGQQNSNPKGSAPQSAGAKRREELVKKIQQELQESENNGEVEGEGAGGESEENGEAGGRNETGKETGSGAQTKSEEPGSSGSPIQSKSGEETKGEGSEGNSQTSEKAGKSGQEGEENAENGESSTNAGSETTDSESESQTEEGEASTLPRKGSELTTPAEEANETIQEEYQITEEALKGIQKAISDEEMTLKKKEENDSEEGELPEFNISSKNFSKAHVKCLNRRVKNYYRDLSHTYGEKLNEYSWGIKNLTKSLKELFKKEREEKRRSTRGGYNILRGTSATTARIFDRRAKPDNKKDARIMLCVDMSESMTRDNKIAEAQKAAITLAEALTNVGIPYSIMGFHAEVDGTHSDVVHEHFVSWKGSKKEREMLAGMIPDGCNMDGYSIRYAAETLKAFSEQNRVIFIISDGLPYCRIYQRDVSIGLTDTASAIKEARKSGLKVFGIAIGKDCSPSVLHQLYGKDFIHVNNPNALTTTLGKKLLKTLA